MVSKSHGTLCLCHIQLRKKKKHLYKMIYLKVQEKLQYWEMKKYESNETH